ncbi:protein hlj1 [Quercus suber]|uniref:Protein hlj1 n=1 Tax=Quercus suber TaxID=58331 RepID=A0AAW0L2Y6_QUESU
MEDPNRAEAERLLGISEKLLQTRDLTGSRDFAILAQETEPLLDGSDQILAVTDVLLAAEKRMNNHHDWYSILQLDRRSDDQELIKKQYRRLALLLHPDKNKFPLADQAFKLVADAWAVLNDTAKKALYDNELTLVYEGCCLRCQNCQRAFHAAVIPSLPPVVPGQDAYYCCWGFFPMGLWLEIRIRIIIIILIIIVILIVMQRRPPECCGGGGPN